MLVNSGGEIDRPRVDETRVAPSHETAGCPTRAVPQQHETGQKLGMEKRGENAREGTDSALTAGG